MKSMEYLMGRMLLDCKAADICARIPPRASCMALAEMYAKQASHVSPNERVMLAIETHLRMMATAAWDQEDVLEALSMMQKARDYYMKQRAKKRRQTRRKAA